MTCSPCEIEARAVEEFGLRYDVSPDEAKRQWPHAAPAIKATCRAVARVALRMAGSDRDRMVRGGELANR